MTNKEIANVFKITGKLMEVHGENDFKARSYANASFQLSRLGKPLADMSPEELRRQKGVGDAIADKIESLINTGSFKLIDELLANTPEGILDMLNIKGLGGKKIRVIWQELGIDNLGELYYACVENRLAKMKGFGEKTQESVKQAIEFYMSNRDRYHFARIEETALKLEEYLNQLDGIDKAQLTGQVRRKCNIIDQIDVLIAGDIEAAFSNGLLTKTAEEDGIIKAKLESGAQVHLHPATTENFAWRLFETTATKDHLARAMNGHAKEELRTAGDEEAIYEKLELPYIVPELREGLGEIEKAKAGAYDDLIKLEDIKGMVHNHSTYSDGLNSLREMAEYCKELGYEYLVMSDHSKTAVYAGGLTEEDIFAQQKEIDQLNEELRPFKIFKSIESDILTDGRLDYSDDILATFDLVIASVHQGLKMEADKATERLIKAIENPYTRILGHMTGRLLLSRPGYPADHNKVIDACAANDVVIELNANPYRLDMDWRWIGRAMDKGVMISINPDAHSKQGFHDTYYGVCSARKGGLTKAMTLNTLSLSDFDAYMAKRKP